MSKKSNYKRTKYINGFVQTLLFPVLLLCLTLFIIYSTGKYKNPEPFTPAFNTSKSYQTNNNISKINNIDSKNAILLDYKSGKILAQKNDTSKCYPASLTKIMTTIVAIENLDDLNIKIPIDQKIFDELNNSNASMTGFLPNENVKAKDLLYGIMLPSGAESSIAVADYISGSEDKFVDLMNKKARKIGMKDTHFENSTGLQDPNHYTTAYDLSILLEYALKNQTFKSIFTAERYSTSPTNVNSTGITFRSTVSEKIQAGGFPSGKIIGGKTGYTENAGLCLASLLKSDDREYILITTGAPKNSDQVHSNISDAFKVYNTYLR